MFGAGCKIHPKDATAGRTRCSSARMAMHRQPVSGGGGMTCATHGHASCLLRWHGDVRWRCTVLHCCELPNRPATQCQAGRRLHFGHSKTHRNTHAVLHSVHHPGWLHITCRPCQHARLAEPAGDGTPKHGLKRQCRAQLGLSHTLALCKQAAGSAQQQGAAGMWSCNEKARQGGTDARPHRQPRVQPRRISTVRRLCTVSTYGTSPICTGSVNQTYLFEQVHRNLRWNTCECVNASSEGAPTGHALPGRRACLLEGVGGAHAPHYARRQALPVREHSAAPAALHNKQGRTS